jgi:hypothetical protein
MRKKSIAILLITITIDIFPSKAQVDLPFFGKQTLLNGYATRNRGDTISYISAFPKYAKQALVTRCSDGKKAIEWTTDVVPKSATGNYVYFSWIASHSTGSSSGKRNFDLYINDVYTLSFNTFNKVYKPYWKFTSDDSTALLFELKKRDSAGEAHGIAYLRVPSGKCKKGESLKLKIVGQSQESNDWFMTFQYKFRENVEATVLPFLLKDMGGKFQPLQINSLHFGSPALLKIYIGVNPPHDFIVKNGFNSFQIPIPVVKNFTTLTLIAEITGLYEYRILVNQLPILND